MDKRTESEKGYAYRAYAVTLMDKDDLQEFISHLPGFMATAEANERQIVVEIWFEPIVAEVIS